MKEVRHRSRAVAHGGAWFPALVLAALPLAGIGLYQRAFRARNFVSFSYPYWAGLPDTQRSTIASREFWFVGMPLAFALIGLWYRRRASRVGIRVNWVPLAAAGVILLALVALILTFPQRHLDPQQGVTFLQDNYWGGLLTPLLPLGLAIIVLGRTERSWALVSSGVWFSIIAFWSCLYGLGETGSGSTMGFGLSLAGPTLIWLTAPLVLFAFAKAGLAVRKSQ